jgi:hypothetical protein
VILIQSIHTAVSGLQTNAQRFSEAAQKVSAATQDHLKGRSTASTAFAGHLAQPRSITPTGVRPVPEVGLVNAIVDMKIATHGYKSSLAVLSVAEEMSRVILDRKA